MCLFMQPAYFFRVHDLPLDFQKGSRPDKALKTLEFFPLAFASSWQP